MIKTRIEEGLDSLIEMYTIEIDEDDGERFFYDYRPKYCPNCGRKIVD